MIEGFEYKHYKGGLYEVIGIALPYNDEAIKDFNMDLSFVAMDALTPKNMPLLEINVWENSNIMICDSELPQVIYRAYEDFNGGCEREYGTEIWARTVNNFFETVSLLDEEDDLKQVKRFSFHFEPITNEILVKELEGVY